MFIMRYQQPRRFCVRQNGGGCFTHNHHGPIPRQYRATVARNVPEETIETAVEMLKKNCPVKLVDVVVGVMSGNRLSKGSLDYLRRSVLKSKHQNESSEESTAVTLMRLLKEKASHFCYFTGTYDEATKLVRLRKGSRKNKGEKKRKSPNEGDMSQTSTGEVETTSREEVANPKDEVSMYVKAVIKALDLGNGEILLGVAWVIEGGRINHMAFPNILGTDVTFGTNNEKRPHLRVTGKNTRNRNFNIADAFLPSMQRYVFFWCFGEALPLLLDCRALTNTSLIPTDQDVHMIEALQSVIKGSGAILGEAYHRLCKWHKVNRNFQLKARKHANTEEDNEFIEEMRDWFYSFCTYIESQIEEKDSLAKLHAVIVNERSNEKISNALLDFTLEFIRTGFEDQLYRLCHRHYMYVWWGKVADNCFSESSNSSLSRDMMGPKPNHRLHIAADCIIEHTEENNRKLRTSAIESLSSRKMRKITRQKTK